MEIRPILSALMRSKTGAILITAQIALTLAILCNALYVVQDRLALAARPSGVDEDVVFQIQLEGFREIEDRAQMQRDDVAALLAIDGVESAAWANQVPLGQSGWSLGLTNDPSVPGEGITSAAYFSPDPIVATLGLELVEGRDFTEADVREVDPRTASLGADTVIITRELGKRLFPDAESYVGQTAYLGSGDDVPAMRVIGVVDTMQTPWAQTVSADANLSFILPVRFVVSSAQYVVRTEPGELARVMAEAETKLLALRQDRLLLSNRSMEEIRDRRYRNQRALAGMLIAVTVGLLLVTGSGIVGMASLWVNQRRKQIGTRRALGATRRDILRYFVTENLLISTAGIALGLALAIALNLFLVKQISLPTLPASYLLAGMATLWVLGVLAVLGPAWRAAAVPPAVATRTA